MSRLFITLFPIILLAQQTGAVGFTTTPVGIVGLEKPVVGEEYVLMPGDLLLVTVGGPMSYAYTAYVSPEGKLPLRVPVSTIASPLTGETEPIYDYVDAVSIWGLSIIEAAQKLTKEFRRYYKRPRVSITLVILRQFVVYVVGEVNKPGISYASPITRVSEMIDSARGLTQIGSRSRIQVVRKDTTIIANIERFQSEGDLSANPVVKDGDVILVPPMKMKVIVRGAVFGRGEYSLMRTAYTGERERYSEGIYELFPGERVSDIIRKAGGIAPWADEGSVYIKREGPDSIERINIDLESAFSGDTIFNLLLEDGDILVVPGISGDVYVNGEVVNPGPFDYQAGLMAGDYIGMAGGPTDVANLSHTSIKRGRDKLRYRSDMIIEPGDEIYVPRQTFKFWQDYLQIGQVITSIVLSWLTYMAIR